MRSGRISSSISARRTSYDKNRPRNRHRENSAGASCARVHQPSSWGRNCGSILPRARSSRCRSRSRPSPVGAATRARPGVTSPVWFRPISTAPACSGRSIRRALSRMSRSASQPRFGDWRQINAQALVTGSVQAQGDGRFRVEFRLWDIGAEQQLAGFAYTTTKQNWRRIAHIIADEIYKRITGEDGYFDTRIVYIAEVRAGRQAGQTAGDHGPGRRQPSVPDRWQVAGLDAAVFAVGARNHLPVLQRQEPTHLPVQHRYRPAGVDRRFSRHDLRAAVFARW